MSDAKLRWPAPAKLNLMLHVIGRRADGYHELQSVFQFLQLGDEIAFELRQDAVIARIGGNEAVPAEQDLILRAARLLSTNCGVNRGVDIRVYKQLPVGGGLGGGSSNAATTLHALNLLWQTGLDISQLAALGLRLGADVPVFIHGQAAFAEGVGEHLTPIDLPEPWYLVINPGVPVATAEIFAAAQLTRDTPAIKICDLFTSTWSNDCTPVVIARYPEVKHALDWLGHYAEAKMSGTGASVFAEFGTQQQACEVRDELRLSMPSWTAFVARGCNRSPLHSFMRAD